MNNWFAVYLVKRAVLSVAQAVGNKGSAEVPMPKVWSLSDQQEMDKLYSQLPPSPRRVPLRRVLARLEVRK